MVRTVACSKFEPSLLLVLLCFSLSLIAGATSKEQRHKYQKQSAACNPPLFVFGASLLDVGENAAAMPGRSVSEFPPYGVHYFGRAAARFSNGRLLIDFISQGLGYGLMDPFLKSLGSNFKHGVNFASSGATARDSTISGNGTSSLGLFSLNVQIDQFIEFKRAALGSKDTALWDDIEVMEEKKPPAALATIHVAQQRPIVQTKIRGANSLPSRHQNRVSKDVTRVSDDGDPWAAIAASQATTKVKSLSVTSTSSCDDNDPWVAIAAPPSSNTVKPLSVTTTSRIRSFSENSNKPNSANIHPSGSGRGVVVRLLP